MRRLVCAALALCVLLTGCSSGENGTTIPKGGSYTVTCV